MIKKYLKAVVVFNAAILLCNQAGGQAGPVGARSAALGGISTTLEEVWAAANNPAGLARLTRYSTAIGLEQRYFMKELGYYAIAASIPSGKGCAGLFTVFSGYSSFINQQLIVAYGRSFGDRTLAGINLVYIYQKPGNESPSIHQVSYSLGTTVILSPAVNLHFSSFNPFGIYYKNKDYSSLSSVFRLGLTYNYSPALALYSEIEKDLNYPVVMKIGMEYGVREIFYLRGGFRVFPASYSFGAAFRHKRYLIEIASYYHQYLGFTPVFSFQYDIK